MFPYIITAMASKDRWKLWNIHDNDGRNVCIEDICFMGKKASRFYENTREQRKMLFFHLFSQNKLEQKNKKWQHSQLVENQTSEKRIIYTHNVSYVSVRISLEGMNNSAILNFSRINMWIAVEWMNEWKKICKLFKKYANYSKSMSFNIILELK